MPLKEIARKDVLPHCHPLSTVTGTMVDAEHSQLIDALLQPACYPHVAHAVERLETHISWVFLAGAYAYKIKKPIRLAFLDFATLEARRHYCEEELRLNHRLAGDLYLDVIAIRGSTAAPRVGGAEGPVIEYALRMRRFAQEALASRVLERGELSRDLVVRLARRIAEFHAQLPPACPSSTLGTAHSVLEQARRNFTEIAALLEDPNDRQSLATMREWSEREFRFVQSELQRRHATGMVRECHGDLHLANIVLIDGELVPFDCIEFNAELRWNDVMSEVAFLMMDLLDRDASGLAWLLLDSYLEVAGDYAGLSVLRFYLVYRAVVRAKVHLLRAHQSAGDSVESQRLTTEYRSYVELAMSCTELGRPAIVLMHGYSGSGKSTIAAGLVEALGAVRVRSDVERKRLDAAGALAPESSPRTGGRYSDTATRVTYARLADAARDIARGGYTAIVDATFLQRWQRTALHRTAEAADVPIAMVDVHLPVPLLRDRIARRAAQAIDPSEATVEVLEQQMATQEPIENEEGLAVIHVTGDEPVLVQTLGELLERLRPHGSSPAH